MAWTKQMNVPLTAQQDKAIERLAMDRGVDQRTATELVLAREVIRALGYVQAMGAIGESYPTKWLLLAKHYYEQFMA